MRSSLKKITQSIISIYKIIRFNKKIEYIYRLNRKAYKHNFNKQKLRDHKRKWSVLKKIVNGKWYKIYTYISGKDSINFVPEDIYFTKIQPKINNPTPIKNKGSDFAVLIAFSMVFFPFNLLISNITITMLKDYNNILIKSFLLIKYFDK